MLKRIIPFFLVFMMVLCFTSIYAQSGVKVESTDNLTDETSAVKETVTVEKVNKVTLRGNLLITGKRVPLKPRGTRDLSNQSFQTVNPAQFQDKSTNRPSRNQPDRSPELER